MAEQAIEDSVGAGHAALARGEWSDARSHFEAALAEGASAEAWEGLGWAAWWLADEELTFEARERAYRAYRREGSTGAAARVAAWLAADFLDFRGDDAIGLGWLARAHRLLDGEPTSADHGWLKLIEANFALNVDHDPDRALPFAREATRIGTDVGVPDLEILGLVHEGIALVDKGTVEDGMRLLDLASAMAASEDLHLPISLGWAMCCMISACDGIGDFARAAQWCESGKEFTDRWGARQLLGLCRSSYGRVLATSGDWPAAEAELTAAVEDLEHSRPGMAAGGLVRLGELRLRQGRAGEARGLFERAGPAGLVGLGELALADGDPAAAADASERFLRRLSPAAVLERLPGLELLARAKSSLGETDAAQGTIAELEAIGRLAGTPYVRARVARTAGELAASRGDHDGARRAYEDAVDGFEEASAPYDAAIARVELARALAALGRVEHAEAERRTAGDVFAALGAARDVARAEEPLPAGIAAGENALDQLTPREVEVLRLVARGMSDAAIAGELVLSPHTVHRHVANIRTKLGLPSRAAAVGYAVREGLL